MSFLVDTGAPWPFYFSDVALEMLRAHHLLQEDDDGNSYVRVQLSSGEIFRAVFMDTPDRFKPANIIGLRFILRVGMKVSSERFSFNNIADYL
jgi:hypothetical protein